MVSNAPRCELSIPSKGYESRKKAFVILLDPCLIAWYMRAGKSEVEQNSIKNRYRQYHRSQSVVEHNLLCCDFLHVIFVVPDGR